ncbi:MAG: ABC transporter ATP-binding protein [Candidatus Wallbacteria bacterium HGW-Wallbacteria-1]|uniref:ABC transporter ATP-binding protein n=1 Tax=Candidatus Wallbacteria bacterium HGW-Wallbacteria-1 TaxID=2013854 RepID=A0A2N1PP29_9BACT|nr:MAG: ABC transporter ATP-binding protein [Candidatus Wallbacteria bacterium HGW-Wallbacteria-1]
MKSCETDKSKSDVNSARLFTLADIGVTRGTKNILSDINLSIRSGEKIVFTGSSGSGKTTLLTLLAGGVKPDSGILKLRGDTIGRSNLHILRRIGAFIQQEPVFSGETVMEMVNLPFSFRINRFHGSTVEKEAHESERLNNLHELLELLSLPQSILKERPSTLSGGEKQRLCIIRALLMNRETIFADEITSALDALSRKRIMELILSSTATVISVSHDNEWIEKCHRKIKLHNGRISEDIHIRFTENKS